jgi:hypothetical protein
MLLLPQSPSAPFTVIDIARDGAIQALYREEAVALGNLGHQSIQRASDLVFHEDTQDFAIHLAVGNGTFHAPVPEAQGFPSYEAARAMEVKWLEMARLHDIAPDSREGRCLLAHMRAGSDALEGACATF